VSDRNGSVKLYENICTLQIYQEDFINEKLNFASPRYVLSQYQAGVQNPYYDYFVSRYRNIWHLQGTSNISTIYGARLESPFDFTVTTNFATQVFFPTHKIILNKKASGINPITDTFDVGTYPSFPRTEMFFYKNFSSMVNDISGQFAFEKTSNFAYSDTQFSGYFFNSYINNISLSKSIDFNNSHPDSFSYLAIRAYSPSESFKSLVRVYLPGRYDFGFISLADLSNETFSLQANPNVNPEYYNTLLQFDSQFNITKLYGGSGLPGFSGCNITTTSFGDFLKTYSLYAQIIASNTTIVSTVNGQVAQGTRDLITGDLRYILPSYISTRERVYDPIEFSLPFSTIIQASNRILDEYGLGYNLGYSLRDTGMNTVHRAETFFKILDDYIYLRMNPEFNMNRLDISRQENFAATHDPTAETNLYNCKLLLNYFGQYATTFVQNPVEFNPPIGKLDKLTFDWYDSTGSIINDTQCEWSAAITITERLDVMTVDSSLPSYGDILVNKVDSTKPNAFMTDASTITGSGTGSGTGSSSVMRR
jgi:hypothetical protein